MRSAASMFHNTIMFKITVLVLISAACLAGCKRRPDRLITAQGQVLSGKLESVDGGVVRISGSEIALEQDEGRVFSREGGIDCRGYIRYADGTFTIGNGTGTLEIPDDEVASIIWSPSSSEARITLEVPAAAGWVSTGMEITEGDRLVVDASGMVSMETGACGPSGIDYFSTAMALVPGATNGELVMAVGETSPVAAGSSWTGDSPGSGELLLAVNRPNRESVAGVGGSFTVTVVRTPGALGHSVLYPSPD